MSTSPIDLFAKKPEHQQRIERNVIRNKDFVNKLDDEFFGPQIQHAIKHAAELLSPAWFAAIRFGYQVREETDRPGRKYMLFTGRSQVQQLLTGKQQAQREVFQFKIEARSPAPPFVHHYNDVGSGPAFDAWQRRFKIQYTAQATVAARLIGMMENRQAGYNILKIANGTPTFEAYLENFELKVRLRVFGDSLMADDYLLNTVTL